MPLTKTSSGGPLTVIWREYDRYLKLAKRVEEICRNDVVEENAIRAQVTFRAKDPKRFEVKLNKYLVVPDESNQLDDVEQVFARVGDLAGVRITTYEDCDRPKVVEAIKRAFEGPDGADVDVDPKVDTSDAYYRATHCQVYLPADELVGTYENLRGVACEIQVSSMLAHVWNEIEHDLRYKPQMGEPSEKENELLQGLDRLMRVGDTVIKHLLEEAERGIKLTRSPSRTSSTLLRGRAITSRTSRNWVATPDRYSKSW